jgi:hypothetical protein
LKKEEELIIAQRDNYELTLKNMKYKAELKVERYMNQIARNYIPEDMLDEYQMEYPNKQPVWTTSSPARKSLNFVGHHVSTLA